MLIIVHDAENRIVGANREFLELVGARESEVLGQTLAQFAISEVLPTSGVQTASPPVQTGKQYLLGTSVPLDACELAAAGGGLQVLIGRQSGVQEDDRLRVTELGQLKAEIGRLSEENGKLRELSAAHAQFVHAVAQELRFSVFTVRTAIKGVCERKPGRINAWQRSLLSMALDHAEDIEESVRDIMDADRIETGRIAARPARVNLSETLDRVAKSYRRIVDQRDVGLTFELPAESIFAWCDPDHYNHVVTYRLWKAIRFTPSGGQIVVKAEPAPGGMVRTSVRDTGIGILEELKPSALGRLEQNPRSAGTGLGLAICKQMVEMNGGKIGFENDEHQGSTFHFTVPAADDTPDGRMQE